MLPRKRRTQARLEVGASAPSYPQTHFLQMALTDFPTLSYTSTSEFRSLSHTGSLKKVPLSGRTSLYRPLSVVTLDCKTVGFFLALAKFHAQREAFLATATGDT